MYFLLLPLLIVAAGGAANGQALDSFPAERIENCAGAPRAGAESVKVIVAGDDSVLLAGVRGKEIVWKRPFPLKQDVNSAKTFVTCKGQRIELVSQAPFSASEARQVFVWDGANLRAISAASSDPSAGLLADAVKAAEAGNVRKLASLDLSSIQYPGSYINSTLLADAIKRGHASATVLYKAGRPGDAAARLNAMFDLTARLNELVSPGGARPGGLESWLVAWRSQHLESKDYVPALNDYGFFLQEAGEHARAIKVFEAVILEDPYRAVAHLNLADSLWAISRKSEAQKHYQSYRRLMTEQKKEKLIPARVLERQ